MNTYVSPASRNTHCYGWVQLQRAYLYLRVWITVTLLLKSIYIIHAVNMYVSCVYNHIYFNENVIKCIQKVVKIKFNIVIPAHSFGWNNKHLLILKLIFNGEVHITTQRQRVCNFFGFLRSTIYNLLPLLSHVWTMEHLKLLNILSSWWVLFLLQCSRNTCKLNINSTCY